MSRTANTANMCPFGQKVSQQLKEKGMTQKELASRLYISTVYLNQLMQGKYPVHLRMVKMIAMVLEINPSDLVSTLWEEKEPHGK